ncbi:unnamed protein product [Phytophthora lilii]|uniref:Unnamed protein product n=1 Tax=Phytophthora lilii TaxID=2077276 RepID=A0A9W6TD57_9STRA|nr:unnamed protein product [Phytophthora lilii]
MIPKCLESSYKTNDSAANASTGADTSNSKRKPFDTSLRPTLSQVSGDWGQRADAASVLASIDQEQLTIIAHEKKNRPGCLRAD